MHKSLGLIALLFALLHLAPARAAPVLSLQPAGASTIGVGGSIDYELWLMNPESAVGAFSVDLAFDAAVLQFRPAATPGAQFGPWLGDADLLEAIGTASVFSPGLLHIDEVSLLDTITLEALQAVGAAAGHLVLAHLGFDGIGPGLGGLAFVADSLQFADAAGTAQTLPGLASPGPLQVIPEPASAALVLLALAAAVGSRRRRA